MKRFVIFAVLFPPIAMLVFQSPDMVTKGIPASEEVLAWVISSYPIVIIPALLMAWADRVLGQPLHILKTTGVGGLMTASVALFLWSGYADISSVLMAALVGAVPALVCSLLSNRPMPNVTQA